VTVCNEDGAVWRDGDLGRRVELVDSRSGDAFLAERHQHATVLIQLEYLMAPVVGHSQIAGVVDGQLVRADEQAGAERLQQLA
jgi:hypothetical protein